MKCSLSVVIPMYNEEAIAAETIKTLYEYLSSLCPNDFELIMVNDGSRDNTKDVVASLLDSYERLRLEGYDDNRGKGCAVRTGILAAVGDYIVFTDCDLAYGADIIGLAYNTLKNHGTDVVIGSRSIAADGYEGYTLLRKLMSKTYKKFIAVFAGFKYSDSQSGIKGFTASAAKNVFSKCEINGFAFDLEALIIASNAGFKVTEIPAKIINHRERESKVSPIKDALRMIKDVRRIKKREKSKKA